MAKNHSFNYNTPKPDEMYKLLLANKNDDTLMNKIITSYDFKMTIENIEMMYETTVLSQIKYKEEKKNTWYSSTVLANTLQDIIPYEVLSHLLNYKIQPSDKLVDNIIKCLCYYDIVATGNKWMYGSTVEDRVSYLNKMTEPENSNRKHKSKMINATQYIKILIQYGYKLKLEQVCELAKYNIRVNNLSDHDIDVNDPKLQNIIGESGYNPYENEMKITLMYLQNKCKIGITLTEIKKYCKTITLDTKCLFNAVERHPVTLVRYLVNELKIPVTIDCVEHALEKNASDAVIRCVFQGFKTYYKEKIDKLEKLEKQYATKAEVEEEAEVEVEEEAKKMDKDIVVEKQKKQLIDSFEPVSYNNYAVDKKDKDTDIDTIVAVEEEMIVVAPKAPRMPKIAGVKKIVSKKVKPVSKSKKAAKFDVDDYLDNN